MRALLLSFLLLTSLAFSGEKSGADFRNFAPDFREYLVSVEHGLINDEAWRSIDPQSVATSAYTSPTSYFLTFDLVDSEGVRMQWFNGSVSGFDVATSVAGAFSAALTTDILNFHAGRSSAGVVLTGTVAIGSTVTVSAPTFTSGIATVSATATRVLTFSE